MAALDERHRRRRQLVAALESSRVLPCSSIGSHPPRDHFRSSSRKAWLAVTMQSASVSFIRAARVRGGAT